MPCSGAGHSNGAVPAVSALRGYDLRENDTAQGFWQGRCGGALPRERQVVQASAVDIKLLTILHFSAQIPSARAMGISGGLEALC